MRQGCLGFEGIGGMKLRCRFGWHNWQMWSEPYYPGLERASQEDIACVVAYSSPLQTRRCQDCREMDYKRCAL